MRLLYDRAGWGVPYWQGLGAFVGRVAVGYVSQIERFCGQCKPREHMA